MSTTVNSVHYTKLCTLHYTLYIKPKLFTPTKLCKIYLKSVRITLNYAMPYSLIYRVIHQSGTGLDKKQAPADCKGMINLNIHQPLDGDDMEEKYAINQSIHNKFILASYSAIVSRQHIKCSVCQRM